MDWWRVVRLISIGTAALSLALGSGVAWRGVRVGGGDPPADTPLTGAEAAAVVAAGSGATVGVSAAGCEGTVAGSGFRVEGRVLTSRHLVAGAATATVVGSSGARAVVGVDGVAARADLARTEPLGADWSGPASELVLAPADPDVGQPVVIVGWAGGTVRHLEARVQLVVEGAAYGPSPVLLLDRAVVPGWSGGAVLDRRGEVVGVVRAVDQATGLTLAVPVSEIHDWLKTETDVAAGTGCVE